MICVNNTLSRFEEMLSSMHQHSAWKADMDLETAEMHLENQPSYTFLLRQGHSPSHFLVSYVERDGSMQHKVIEIINQNAWFHINFNPCGYCKTTLPEILAVAMHCQKEQCTPLA